MIQQARRGQAQLLPAAADAEIAILRTVLYADVFDYPLTLSEIHRYLIGRGLSLEAVRATLESSDWLAGRLASGNGYYAAAGRMAVAALRQGRAARAPALWQAARRYGRLLAHLPFVRMVAVTGALALDNVETKDDIDYLIVTAPGRVWLARALVIAVVRLARLAGANLCPNYILADSALRQQRRDLFVAHELAQMVPLAGHSCYWRMRSANAWTARYLPNANVPPRTEADAGPRGLGLALQRLLEWLLAGRVGTALEGWERRRKLARFAPQLRQPGSAAILDETQVKGHFDDYGGAALDEYRRRCMEHLGAR